MSVEEVKDIQKEDISAELEDATPEAQAILDAMLYGDEPVEEPETPEVEEVPVEPVVKEEAPVAEVAITPEEEPAGPEWAADLPQDNEKIKDAVAYFENNEAVDWMTKGYDKMDDDEKEALKQVQSNRDKWLNSQKEELDPKQERKTRLEEEAYDRIEKILHPEQEPTKPQEPEVDVKAQVRELYESGDTDAAFELMQSATEQTVEKRLAQKAQALKDEIKSEITTDQQKQRQSDYIREFDAYGLDLAEKDPRFKKMIERGEDGLSALERIYAMGKDPMTGREIVNGKNPVEDINNAYGYYLGSFKTSSRNGRPSVTAQPQPGDVEGNIPALTEADMELKPEDFFEKFL